VTERTDFDLLTAWGEGDDRAGEELLGRHVGVLHRFFSSKLRTDVEDLAQATLLASLEGRASFRRDASFKTYLLAIARRQLFMHLRKRFRGDRAMRLQEVSMEAVLGTPSAVVGHREELKLLHRVMQQIPIDLQITLELYYWENLSVAEVGEVLEIPAGTVKSRLSRARDVLRQKILEADADEHLKKSTVHDLEDWARKLRDDIARG
jgi:RNA polymerase sigma factor (sigma-70 family)